MDTFLIEVVACQWSVIDPVERFRSDIVRLFLKSNPRSPILDLLLLHNQVRYEVILIGWSDYGEVSTQILASRTSVAPFKGWSVDDVVTWMSMKNPTLRTIWNRNRIIKVSLPDSSRFLACFFRPSNSLRPHQTTDEKMGHFIGLGNLLSETLKYDPMWSETVWHLASAKTISSKRLERVSFKTCTEIHEALVAARGYPALQPGLTGNRSSEIQSIDQSINQSINQSITMS